MIEGDRQELMSFLSSAQGVSYAPQSGDILGILKQLKDSMSGNLAEATAQETAAIKTYEELMAAKKKEVAALIKAIEKKTVRSGEVAVNIVDMKEDLSDT